MLTIDQRAKNARRHADQVLHQKQVEQRIERERTERVDKRRNYILGELVSQYFPEVTKFEPGTKAENAARFAPFIGILKILSGDTHLLEDLKERALRQESKPGVKSVNV